MRETSQDMNLEFKKKKNISWILLDIRLLYDKNKLHNK